MSPALSNRPVKGAVFFLCAAAHAAVLLMLAQADMSGTGVRRESAHDMLVPVKIPLFTARVRQDSKPAHQALSPAKATRRQPRKSHPDTITVAKSPPPPQKPALPETTAKSVSPIIPLLANPLGQGHWGLAHPAPTARNEVMQAQIQQEHTALRMSLMDRLAVWMGQQMQERENPDCLIRLSQDSRQARLSCTSTQTEATLWPALAGLALPGNPPAEDMICIAVGKGRIDFIDCNRTPDGQGDTGLPR